MSRFVEKNRVPGLATEPRSCNRGTVRVFQSIWTVRSKYENIEELGLFLPEAETNLALLLVKFRYLLSPGIYRNSPSLSINIIAI